MTGLVVLHDADTSPALLDALRELVFGAFADRFDEHDWAHGCDGWRVVALDGDRPVSHAALVHRELFVAGSSYDAGYVEAVATAPDRQREGLGSQVMAQVGDLVRAEYALGALSTSRHAFYESLGWERWRGPSYVLRAGGRDRTPDEDDGLMVLRAGRSTELDLTADIACRERPGDDW